MRDFFQALFRRRSNSKRRRREALLLRLEVLEDRWLLSAYSVLHDTPLNVNAAAGLVASHPGDTISGFTYPDHGNVYVNSDGSFLYSPPSA